MIEKPDKLSNEEYWKLYKEIANDVLDDKWEWGDIAFVSGLVAIVIIIWETITYFV